MTLADLPELILFMLAVLMLALYGLTVSGHFPVEHRAEHFKTASGHALMWATIAVACAAALVTGAMAWRMIPWYAAVIAAGLMLLIAPLLLQPFPDTFVNGRRGLIVFAAGSVAAATLLWWLSAT